MEGKWKGKMKGREQTISVAPCSQQLTDMPTPRSKATVSISIIKGKGLNDNASRKPRTAREEILL